MKWLGVHQSTIKVQQLQEDIRIWDSLIFVSSNAETNATNADGASNSSGGDNYNNNNNSRTNASTSIDNCAGGYGDCINNRLA